MKKVIGILVALVLCLSASFVYAGPCGDGYEQIVGSLVVEGGPLSPNAVGDHGFDYQIAGSLYGHQLTVKYFWQSDTYPGWRLFKTVVNDLGEFTWCQSGTNDNVRYRVEFWTNSPGAYADWMFCKDW